MAAEEEPPIAFHSYPPAVVFVPPPPPLRMRGGTIFSCAEGHRLRLIPSLLSPMVMVMTVVVADLKGCESGRKHSLVLELRRVLKIRNRDPLGTFHRQTSSV